MSSKTLTFANFRRNHSIVVSRYRKVTLDNRNITWDADRHFGRGRRTHTGRRVMREGTGKRKRRVHWATRNDASANNALLGRRGREQREDGEHDASGMLNFLL